MRTTEHTTDSAATVEAVHVAPRVGGEALLPWGAVEVSSLGGDQVLLDAGGAYTTGFERFDECCCGG